MPYPRLGMQQAADGDWLFCADCLAPTPKTPVAVDGETEKERAAGSTVPDVLEPLGRMVSAVAGQVGEALSAVTAGELRIEWGDGAGEGPDGITSAAYRPGEEGAPGVPPEQAVRTVRFAFDSADMTAAQRETLSAMAGALRRRAGEIWVTGYTDHTGGEEYNDHLALRRAQSVRDALVELGVEAGRIQVRGYGSCCYVATNSTPAGRAANRRVVVTPGPDNGRQTVAFRLGPLVVSL